MIPDLLPDSGPKVETDAVEFLLNARDTSGARQVAEAALRKFPGNREVLNEHVAVLARLGQYDTAIREIEGLPNYAFDRQALVDIASVQDRAKRYAEASRTIDSLAAISTNDSEQAEAHYLRGAMREHEGNTEAAEAEFRKVLAADPKSSAAMNYLGYMFADRGVRLEEARQLISRAIELEPDNGAYFDSLGWTDFRMGRLDQAAEELRKSIETQAGDPLVLDHLADVYFKQGKIGEAVREWEASVAAFQAALPGDQDPAGLARVTKKLENARVRAAAGK